MIEKEKCIYSKIVALIGIILTLLVLGIGIVFCPRIEAEEISGSIYTGFNDHWGAKGNVKPPIVITGEVTVESRTKLVIDPGTLVLFTDNGRIEVKGELVAKGKEDDWVIFVFPEFRKYINSSDRTILEFCYFGGSGEISVDGGTIKKNIFDNTYLHFPCLSNTNIISNFFLDSCIDALIFDSRLIINKNIFEAIPTILSFGAGDAIEITEMTEKYARESGELIISRNVINKYRSGIKIRDIKKGRMKITGNLIVNNLYGILFEDAFLSPPPDSFLIAQNAIYDNSKYNFLNEGIGRIIVRNNYWGSDPPEVKKFKGDIEFSPWLKEFPAEVIKREKTEAPTLDDLVSILNRMLEGESVVLRGYAEERLREYGFLEQNKKEEKQRKIREIERRINELQDKKREIEKKLKELYNQLAKLTSNK